MRLAWVYLREDPGIGGIDRFVRALRSFAADAGRPELYHETVTRVFLLLMRERMAGDTAGDFERFAAANPEFLSWKPSVLERYYRAETLASPRVRRVFMMPDRGLPQG